MKNSINTILFCSAVSVSALLAGGCSKFLEPKPNGVLVEDFKTTPEDSSALISVYDVLGWYNTQEIGEWTFGDICSDDAYKGGQSAADQSDMNSLRSFNATGSNLFIPPQWTEPYEGIRRANLVIDSVVVSGPDAVARAQIVAEAKFCRAYFYFNLVKVFGGVPLTLHALTFVEGNVPRSPIDSCWAQIEKDLTEAAAVLPHQANTDMGRATWGAAIALHVKACLFQTREVVGSPSCIGYYSTVISHPEKFIQAQQLADTLIKSKDYSLDPDYSDFFSLNSTDGASEVVFDIQHVSVTVTGDQFGDGNEGTVTPIFQCGRNYVGGDGSGIFGNGFDDPTNSLDSEFETDDPRRDATIIHEQDTIWPFPDYSWDSIYVDPVSGKSDTVAKAYLANNKDDYTNCLINKLGGKHARKYLPDGSLIASTPDYSNFPGNWHVIRYADVLLMGAEAACENGNLATAVGYVNQVRERAGMDDLSGAATTDQAALRDAIYHERRVELGMEGIRFFDVVRQGRGPDLFKDRSFKQGRDEHFHLPTVELQQCPALVDNH